ncbi:MAG: dihydroorotase family protein [Chloroflexi bacterium]|nr:dihydroorotase family protein [Chloroflexota bacterium]
MFDFILRGGAVVTSAGAGPADIGIAGGRIAALARPGELTEGHRVSDVTGALVLPGLVDAHVHLRDPGFTHKEDFRSGTMAAAAGGVTTVLAIPNTDPPITTPAALDLVLDAARTKAVVDYGFFAGLVAAEPAGIDTFAGAPILAYDLHDEPYEYGTERWIEIFTRVQATGLPVCFYVNEARLRAFHAEQLSGSELEQHERWVGSTPGALEVSCIGRVFAMAAQIPVPVVLRSVTTAAGLEHIRQLRRLLPGTPVTVETNPHYLVIAEPDLGRLGTRAHMAPPLRPADEQPSLWAAIADGTVDYIGTDHAPHAATEKAAAAGDLWRSPTGIVGLETWLPLLLTACADGRLRWTDLVRLCCERPARTYGLWPRKGAVAIGADADLVVVDPTARWQVDAARFYTRGDAGPFDGWTMVGRPVLTLSHGRVVMQDGKVDESPAGRLVTREA